jgi:hypothetical protein
MQKTSRRNSLFKRRKMRDLYGMLVLTIFAIVMSLIVVGKAHCYDCGGTCQFDTDCDVGCDCIKRPYKVTGSCI